MSLDMFYASVICQYLSMVRHLLYLRSTYLNLLLQYLHGSVLGFWLRFSVASAVTTEPDKAGGG